MCEWALGVLVGGGERERRAESQSLIERVGRAQSRQADKHRCRALLLVR